MQETSTSSLFIEPGGVIGILGGGQLGRMLAIAAAEIGLKVHIFCPEEHCPAREVASAQSIAAYDDETALTHFAGAVDVITYEFENVPIKAVKFLTNLGAVVRPDAKALETAQDRLTEKEFLNTLGAHVAPFHAVNDLADLQTGLNQLGRPAILKTRRLGYDGKGQTRLTDKDIDLHGAFEKAIEYAWSEVGAAPSILEGHIEFVREISIIGARGVDSAIALYDPTENVHGNGILQTSTVPTLAAGETIARASTVTKKLLEDLNYVGVIGVEFFVLSDGGVIVNEFAPRVHNSGHWTQDACAISQFEQHIRAVAGWPLGDPARHSNVVMENLIGDAVEQWREFSAIPGNCVHLYGKSAARPGRKMGHVTKITALG